LTLKSVFMFVKASLFGYPGGRRRTSEVFGVYRFGQVARHPEGGLLAMRIAVVSDIHGNLTALEAVLADIREQAPDLALHGGDLADGGSSPVEVIDRIRGLGWQGVMGNTDEMLVQPEALDEFAAQSNVPPSVWVAVRGVATATRAMLGEERLGWLHTLPRTITQTEFALVHASPTSPWRAPAADATEAEIEATYGSMGEPVVAYGHTHLPTIRRLGTNGTPKLLINAGSAGLPYDGDQRASYLLLDNGEPTIRRVEYNVGRELRMLAACGLPGAAWTATMLRAGRAVMP
jgi:putative phosphoesterase